MLTYKNYNKPQLKNLRYQWEVMLELLKIIFRGMLMKFLERNPIVILTNIYLNNKRIDFNDMYIEMVEMALNVIFPAPLQDISIPGYLT